MQKRRASFTCFYGKEKFPSRKSLVKRVFPNGKTHLICKGCEAVLNMRAKKAQMPQEDQQKEGKLLRFPLPPMPRSYQAGLLFTARVVIGENGELTLDEQSLKRLR